MEENVSNKQNQNKRESNQKIVDYDLGLYIISNNQHQNKRESDQKIVDCNLGLSILILEM
ncbi:hypothetical protein WA1_23755 [Scytonema hofmannii PCC 7110]|uniref:Uncharacterized protein n=1 Tax=Scytonema hofmannii PCC 7110 TaxID=128403 RepID=A0A139X7Q6_9CYAN|nr:hypothetical protein WA1_23755 [Scytonema hofmannii PCC 7110]